jgi:transcriptional regulator with XRE-family HTH domain
VDSRGRHLLPCGGGSDSCYPQGFPLSCLTGMLPKYCQEDRRVGDQVDSATIGELIRRKRKVLRLNQAAVGERFGINQSSVAKWERGAKPNTAQLPEIAKFLGMPLAEVLDLYHGTTTVDFDETIEEIRDAVLAIDERLARMEKQMARLTARPSDGGHRSDGLDPRRRRRAAPAAG